MPKFLIVSDTQSGELLRWVIPTSEAELADPVHAANGETAVVLESDRPEEFGQADIEAFMWVARQIKSVTTDRVDLRLLGVPQRITR